RAESMPAPPSVDALPPIPRWMLPRPERRAARRTSPTPRLEDSSGRSSSPGRRSRPHASAISTNAVSGSIAAKAVSTVSPVGPEAVTGTVRAPPAAITSRLPPPPSATGRSTTSVSGWARRAPVDAWRHASIAVRAPLKAPQATTIVTPASSLIPPPGPAAARGPDGGRVAIPGRGGGGSRPGVDRGVVLGAGGQRGERAAECPGLGVVRGRLVGGVCVCISVLVLRRAQAAVTGALVHEVTAGVGGDTEAAELDRARGGRLGVEVHVQREAARVDADVGAERTLEVALLGDALQAAGLGGGLLGGGEAGERDGGTDAERTDCGDPGGRAVGGLPVGVGHLCVFSDPRWPRCLSSRAPRSERGAVATLQVIRGGVRRAGIQPAPR